MDWNSDGEWDIISGDRNGYLNVFIRDDTALTAYKQYKLMDATVLDVGSNSEPNVFDWNGDGKKDLIIGVQTRQVRVYLNQTSDTWPMFQSYSTVQAGGTDINLYRVNPYMFDLDRDGKPDLICGEDRGYVHFFKNVGSATSPEFAAGETLKLQNGTPVRWRHSSYYYGSRCGFGDWNNDSIPDFLMSTYDGQIELYLGFALTGVNDELRMPIAEFRVNPVPGGPPVRISYSLSRTASASIEILDGLGREVRNLGVVPAGRQRTVEWDGTDGAGRRMPAGVYFCRLVAGEDSRTGRVVLSY